MSVPIAAALLCICLPALASEASSDGFPPAQNLNYTHIPGADQAFDRPPGLLGGESYLFIAGSAFTPRTSSQTVTYPGGGCSYSTAALTTSLEMPDGATISGVRVYYYNVTPLAALGMFLTTYPGNGTSSDLLTGNLTSSSGYSSEYIGFTNPLLIDNFTGAYALTATTAAGTRLCGMRVFYTP